VQDNQNLARCKSCYFHVAVFHVDRYFTPPEE